MKKINFISIILIFLFFSGSVFSQTTSEDFFEGEILATSTEEKQEEEKPKEEFEGLGEEKDGESCDTIFCDDFNDYSSGDLNGQGYWTGGTSFAVQDSEVFEGSYAVGNLSAGDYTCQKTGSAKTDGVFTFYFYTKTASSWGSGRYMVLAINAGTSWGNTPVIYVVFRNDNKIDTVGVSDWVSWTDDEWHSLKFEWRSSPDYKFRVSYDGGTFSDWEAGSGGDWSSGLKTFACNWYISGGEGAFYWDHMDYDFYEEETSTETTTDQINDLTNYIVLFSTGIILTLKSIKSLQWN